MRGDSLNVPILLALLLLLTRGESVRAQNRANFNPGFTPITSADRGKNYSFSALPNRHAGGSAQGPSDAQREIAQILDRAIESALKVEDAAIRSETLMMIATHQMLAGNYEGARHTAGKMPLGGERTFVMAMLAGKEAKSQAGAASDAALRPALESFPPAEQIDARRKAQSMLILGQAAGGDFTGARKSLNAVSDPRTRIESILMLIATEALSPELGDPLQMLRDAAKAAGGIKEMPDRDRLLAGVAHGQAQFGDPASALKTAARVKDSASRPLALQVSAMAQVMLGELETARKTTDAMAPSPEKERALWFLAVNRAMRDMSAALSAVDSVPSGECRVGALLEISAMQRNLDRQEDSVASFERAVKEARALSESRARSNAFAMIMADQAGRGKLADAQNSLAETGSCDERGLVISTLAGERTKAGEGKAVLAWADGEPAPQVRAWILVGLAAGMIQLEADALQKQRAKEAESLAPPRFAARLTDGSVIGEIVLGVTTLDEAKALFPKAPSGSYIGNPRKPLGIDLAPIEGFQLRPSLVFNPWGTMYALYFDGNDRLILFQELGGKLEGLSREEITRRFPTLKEGERVGKGPEIEIHGEIAPDVTLVVVVDPGDRQVVAALYVFTGKTTRSDAKKPAETGKQPALSIRLLNAISLLAGERP